jgi:small-conductance mechanosensitive channel
MKKEWLSPPKLITWWISFICLVVGVLLALRVLALPSLTPYTFWIVVVGLVLMLAATRLRGL